MAEKILIVGCGYVGTEVAKRLLAAGDEVVALRRRTAALPEGIDAIQADVVTNQGFEGIPSDVSSVVYALGADGHDEAAYERAYVVGVRNLLTHFRITRPYVLRRIIFTSSTGVYAEKNGGWVDEESELEAVAFNGRLVHEGEELFRESGVPSVCLRFGGIYGPGRARAVSEVRENRGKVDRNEFAYTNRIHRDDCARAVQHVLGLENPRAVYNAVDTEPCTKTELYDWLALQTGATLQESELSSEIRIAGKRCRSDKLRTSGFSFTFPTFREGYSTLLA